MTLNEVSDGACRSHHYTDRCNDSDDHRRNVGRHADSRNYRIETENQIDESDLHQHRPHGDAHGLRGADFMGMCPFHFVMDLFH